MEGFFLELERIRPLIFDKKIISIYFGGGTPSLLGPERIAKILEGVNPADSIEVTLEANPENITLELMNDYKQAGINRVSIGIQSLNDPLLKVLERTHSAQKGLDAIDKTFQAGIQNISIDLMYDLPNQTLTDWKKTLMTARDLPIQHLSLYNLVIEPHTAFFKYRDSILPRLPSEDSSLAMYEMALSLLQEKGLMQYEISAFSTPNHHSVHNLGYWTGRPFFGLGPSAFSYWEGKRFRNVANLNTYCKSLASNTSPIDFQEELTPAAKIRELLAIRLRLNSGVHLPSFPTLSDETLKTLASLESKGYLALKNQIVSLTKKGILFYDTVASELI